MYKQFDQIPFYAIYVKQKSCKKNVLLYKSKILLLTRAATFKSAAAR